MGIYSFASCPKMVLNSCMVSLLIRVFVNAWHHCLAQFHFCVKLLASPLDLPAARLLITLWKTLGVINVKKHRGGGGARTQHLQPPKYKFTQLLS